ncbi:MAG: spore germination protein [Lachnospiraceae bacterium]|jgi:stage V sporulation protein AF|nr:spore germination protein [Lachnospiraceae bacterium]MCI9106723.1 spore germination protein [Lachnospiraceae bacterium]MCI9342763.1 spore germination protein [Lachnospiraceae bacterium]GFH93107.1 spore germination protein B1 [Lachnospiraceae bacterium]
MELSSSLEKNIEQIQSVFPIPQSFDIVTRRLFLGETKAYWIGINGFCRVELLQQIFSDLQNPIYMKDNRIEDIERYMNAKIGYAQASLSGSWEDIISNILSGPSALFIDGFAQAIMIDVRTYPARSVSEPDTERVTLGARDGFVETMLFNTNLIRRRIRSPRLTFEMQSIGAESKTDVAIAYLDNNVNHEFLARLKQSLTGLSVTSLTMGAKSLEELLVKKRWFHPLPCMHYTERPDVACSFLMEGHIVVIVDNSPSVLILPCTVFQFMQSPEDYYKSPVVGTYFRLIRFLCIPVSLILMPLFLLLTVYFPEFSEKWEILSTESLPGPTIIFYIFAVEFLLDLFKYSASVSSSRFSGSLSIIGGLIIGDIAVELNWASVEILFYAAVTLLTSLSLASIEFSDALRVYRLFLVITTALFGLWGFLGGLALVLLSVITTPTFGGMSYFWPLYPFQWKALCTLLLRYPTASAQPSKVWKHR